MVHIPTPLDTVAGQTTPQAPQELRLLEDDSQPGVEEQFRYPALQEVEQTPAEHEATSFVPALQAVTVPQEPLALQV